MKIILLLFTLISGVFAANNDSYEIAGESGLPTHQYADVSIYAEPTPLITFEDLDSRLRALEDGRDTLKNSISTRALVVTISTLGVFLAVILFIKLFSEMYA